MLLCVLFCSGEIHDYDEPLEGHGNVTECYELIRHHFLEKVAQEIDLACLQVRVVPVYVYVFKTPELLLLPVMKAQAGLECFFLVLCPVALWSPLISKFSLSKYFLSHRSISPRSSWLWTTFPS